MPRSAPSTIATVLAIVAGLFYYFFYTPSVYKRVTEGMLDYMELMASGGSAKVNTAFVTLLSDSAEIYLEVRYPAAPGQTKRPVAAQKFTKAAFIAYMSHLMTFTENYRFKGKLGTLHVDKSKQKAALHFTSTESATSLAAFEQTFGIVKYSGQTECDAEIILEGQRASFSKLSCLTDIDYAFLRQPAAKAH